MKKRAEEFIANSLHLMLNNKTHKTTIMELVVTKVHAQKLHLTSEIVAVKHQHLRQSKEYKNKVVFFKYWNCKTIESDPMH